MHLDATCEGDSPKLVSSIDPVSGFVLYSAKIKSENKDDLIGFLKENGKRLFSDPMTVYVNGEKRIIFILRTNNILEQHFRRFNYWCRKIHGNHSVRRNLENIPEQFPMVENLKNPNYVQLIFGDENKIAEKFAKVEKNIITDMRNNLKTKQKIYSSNKIKKTIRNPDFKKLLIGSFASAAS